MSKLKIEAFLSGNSCSDNLSKILQEIEGEFEDQVEIIRYREDGGDVFKEYNLTARPALIIEELIRIMGFCPSKESLLAALRETGME